MRYILLHKALPKCPFTVLKVFLVRLIESIITVKRLINGRDQHQAPVVQKVDKAIHWINLYPLGRAIGFPNTYPLDSDLSG